MATTRGSGIAWRAAFALQLLLSPSIAVASTDNQSKKQELPEFTQIAQLTLRYFEGYGIGPGEIIARSEVEGLLKHLRRLGWNVPGKKSLLDATPKDESYLVRVLRKTDEGKAFGRQIAKFPMGYDRLDRLSRLPQGKQTIRDLIKGPDGHELIKYMTTSAGGKALGVQLGGAGAKNFNKPTGLTYTPEQLIAALKHRYEVSVGSTSQP